MGVPVGMPPWAVLLSVLLLAWIRVTLVSAVVNGEVGLKVSILEDGLRMAPSCQRTVSQIELTNLVSTLVQHIVRFYVNTNSVTIAPMETCSPRDCSPWRASFVAMLSLFLLSMRYITARYGVDRNSLNGDDTGAIDAVSDEQRAGWPGGRYLVGV